MPSPTWIGQTLGGRYLIESLLGQGGMSAVYKARDPNLRRTVAIKLIHPHLATDPGFVRRFEEEAAAVAGLRHANIVQVFDFNHDDETYYMVLEFVLGQSLHEQLQDLHAKGQRLPINEVVRLMVLLCDAVHYAHERGLIHRDLKPANVMITPANQPILMDFGVAKIVGGKQFTATGAVVGTPAYVAPEIVRGQKPDRRVDIYALGIMLFEMLAGQLPFDADSAMSLMLKHLTEPVPDLKQLSPGVPASLITVVQKALAKEPDQRYQTAAELAQALRAGSTGPVTTSQTIPPTIRPTLAPEAQTRRNPMMAISLIALVAVCGLALVATIIGGLAFNWLRATGTPVGLNPTSTTAAIEIASPTSSVEVSPSPTLPQVTATEAVATQVAPVTETPTLLPTDTIAPTSTATPAPTSTPVTLYASITGIRIEGGRYVVDFQTFNYQSALPGQHIHLFFNTVPPEQAGSPGNGPWFVHGAGSPVSPYAVSEKPANATQMCILVANPDHTIILNSGNCVDLPQ